MSRELFGQDHRPAFPALASPSAGGAARAITCWRGIDIYVVTNFRRGVYSFVAATTRSPPSLVLHLSQDACLPWHASQNLRSVAHYHHLHLHRFRPFITRWFWREGCLDRLTRAHLVRLVKACNTVPPFKKATATFAPRSSLVSWLCQEAESIR